jgi:hypothetical protein
VATTPAWGPRTTPPPRASARATRRSHGLALEWGLALAILGVFGLTAFFAFLIQAFSAVRLLEAVNYFEHWGLTRRGQRPRPEDSWDTHSGFTYYALIGLTRHADHHAAATRPYQKLRVREEAPLLPAGYIGTVDLVMGRNADFQQLAAEELARGALGPFAAEDRSAAEAPHDAVARLRSAQATEAAPDRARGPIARRWRALPALARAAIVTAGLLLVTAAGVQWETGGAQMSLPARLAHHAWILGSFVVVLGGRRRLGERVGENLSWVLAFAAILATGLLSSLFV